MVDIQQLDGLIRALAVMAIPLLLAITLHEVAHGWVALYLGDQTASMLGRLSLNPIRHVDGVGTILVPLATWLFSGMIFGWAKPVPINTRYLRSLRRDMALIAIAGPLANAVMACLWAALMKLIIWMLPSIPLAWKTVVTFLIASAQAGMMINCILMCLNCLPVPPLDGSRVLLFFLPAGWASWVDAYESWGLYVLLGLLILGVLSAVLLPMVNGSMSLLTTLFHLPTLT